jgi:hypothetical protein
MFDGTVLRGMTPDERDLVKGQAVNAAIRPEDVRLAMDGDSGCEGVVASGPVTACIFHGDHLMLHVDIFGCGVAIRVNPNEASRVPPCGETIRVMLPSRSTLALAGSDNQNNSSQRKTGGC